MNKNKKNSKKFPLFDEKSNLIEIIAEVIKINS